MAENRRKNCFRICPLRRIIPTHFQVRPLVSAMYLCRYVFRRSRFRFFPAKSLSPLLNFVAVLVVCGAALAQTIDDVHIVPKPEPHKTTFGMAPTEKLKIDVE